MRFKFSLPSSLIFLDKLGDIIDGIRAIIRPEHQGAGGLPEIIDYRGASMNVGLQCGAR